MEFYIERYRGMEEKIYNCEVVTPLFMSGADQNQVEIRASSIKGLIRFWWRAHFQGNLEDMIKEEAKLFGSTEVKSLLDVVVNINSELKSSRNPLPRSKMLTKNGKIRGDIIKFLEYGAHKRDFITPGVKFDLQLKFQEKYRIEIEQAVSALLAVGNLGSKSRNGFGSIHYVGNNNYQIPKRETLPQKYINFSLSTRQYLTMESYGSWSDALAEIGLAYGNARFSLNDSKSCEKRKLLAKPINQAHVGGRLSKPVFLHVKREDAGKYRGQITIFPTLPENNNEIGAYNQMMESFLMSFESNTSLQEVR